MMKYVTNEIFPHGLGTRMFFLINAIGYSIIEDIEYVITPFSYQTDEREFDKNPMTKTVNYQADCNRYDSLLNLDRKRISDIKDLSEVLYLCHPTSYNGVPPVGEQFGLYNKIRELRHDIKRDFLKIPSKVDNGIINVAVHIRRGDIIGIKNRFIGNDYYINNLNTLEGFLQKRNIEYNVTIYTQRHGFVNKGFEKYQIIYDDGITDNEVWIKLLNSDILLGSNSAFSTSVGMLMDGTFIHPLTDTFVDMSDWLYGDNLTYETMNEKIKKI